MLDGHKQRGKRRKYCFDFYDSLNIIHFIVRCSLYGRLRRWWKWDRQKEIRETFFSCDFYLIFIADIKMSTRRSNQRYEAAQKRKFFRRWELLSQDDKDCITHGGGMNGKITTVVRNLKQFALNGRNFILDGPEFRLSVNLDLNLHQKKN